MGYRITAKLRTSFEAHLRSTDHSEGTVQKYGRDIRNAARWLEGREATPQLLARWRDALMEQGYAAPTVNSMVSAVNGLSAFAGCPECRIRFLRIQRCLFREESKHLTLEEYQRLVRTARALGRIRSALMIETLASTGMRVSEARFLTVEALRRGRIDIRLKGKVRTILLPEDLCARLERYCAQHQVCSGPVFRSRSGRALSRRQIWRDMKALCTPARLEPSKVFPHNLRHLFATVFYQACRDLAGLADVLGHSCLDTTRIYLKASRSVHAARINGLPLLI